MSVDISTLGVIKMKGTGLGNGVLSISAPNLAANTNLVLNRQSLVSAATNTDRTLSADESGAIQLVSAAAARILDIPDPSTCAGARFYFVIQTAGANTVTIRSTGANIRGMVTASATTVDAVNYVTAGATSVIFAVNQALGAFVEVISDGASYLLRGQSGIATGFTFA